MKQIIYALMGIVAILVLFFGVVIIALIHEVEVLKEKFRKLDYPARESGEGYLRSRRKPDHFPDDFQGGGRFP